MATKNTKKTSLILHGFAVKKCYLKTVDAQMSTDFYDREDAKKQRFLEGVRKKVRSPAFRRSVATEPQNFLNRRLRG